MKNDIKEILFTEEQLADKVAELGARITADYRGQKSAGRQRAQGQLCVHG